MITIKRLKEVMANENIIDQLRSDKYIAETVASPLMREKKAIENSIEKYKSNLHIPEVEQRYIEYTQDLKLINVFFEKINYNVFGLGEGGLVGCSILAE